MLELLPFPSTPLAGMREVKISLCVAVFCFAGYIEYTGAGDLKFPSGAVKFTLKMDTDLFALAKAKTTARSLEVSKDGEQFAAFCGDGRVRVWRFATGKLRRTYDESLEVGGRWREPTGKGVEEWR